MSRRAAFGAVFGLALGACVPTPALPEPTNGGGARQAGNAHSDSPAETAPLPGRLRIHRPNYVLPLTWTDDGAGDEDIELKFQVSLKHPIGGWPLYFGYTQTAYWRWLDEGRSRPFREINFNPELWYRVRPGRLPGQALDWLGIDFGLEHESNGEDVPASRSWNRLYARTWLDQGPWRAMLKLWYRVPEKERDGPNDPKGDDNPRIGEFYGNHELNVSYTFAGGAWLQASSRYAFDTERGALRLRYAHPTPTRRSRFFVELFSGYGESLETFKKNRSRLGIGFAFVR